MYLVADVYLCGVCQGEAGRDGSQESPSISDGCPGNTGSFVSIDLGSH